MPADSTQAKQQVIGLTDPLTSLTTEFFDSIDPVRTLPGLMDTPVNRKLLNI